MLNYVYNSLGQAIGYMVGEMLILFTSPLPINCAN